MATRGTASSDLVRNLQDLGLPVDRPHSPVHRASYNAAEGSSAADEKDEDGRPATPANLGPVPQLTPSDVELLVYNNSRAFIEATRFLSRSWRLNPILGESPLPCGDEVRAQAVTQDPQRPKFAMSSLH